jgi:ABC-type antimicrobial peptide transport system permease subunit
MQGDPRPFLDALIQRISGWDENMAVYFSGPMMAQLTRAISQPKIMTLFSSLTATLMIFLTGLGIFGVMAQMVLSGSPELGLRIALGASPADICRLIARAAALMILGGIIAGIPLSIGLAQILAHQLHGISTMDAITFIGVPLLIAAIVVFACYFPVRRAIRISPIEALRWE